MARTLRECETEPEVVSLARGEYWEAPLRELGVPVHYVGAVRSRMVRAARIARLARRIRPDIVQSAHFYVNVYACIAARAAGAHEIGAIRGDTRHALESLGRWGRLALRMPRTLATNSLRARSQAIELGVPASRLVYVPSVVDTSVFARCESATGPQITLLTVGRLVEVKRHDRFLRVLRRVVDEAPSNVSVRGVILGYGPLRAALDAQAATLRLHGDALTIFADPDSAPAYRSANIFVLSSDHEGTPNVVLEAMAAGLAVVACDVGEVTNVIDDGVTGFIVSPGDEDLMVKRVLELVVDDTKRDRFGSEARRRVEQNSSTSVLADELTTLYQQAGLTVDG
jgi:glycosyltransferase involved in cell wall biosynthesis